MRDRISLVTGRYVSDSADKLEPTPALKTSSQPKQWCGGRRTLLEPGTWPFAIGTHNRSCSVDRQYEALIQAGPFIVRRDQTSDYSEGTMHPLYGSCLGGGRWTNDWRVPSFGLNIHRGGVNTTGSEGCQTIYKPQWDSFIAAVRREMKRYGQNIIQYVLADAPLKWMYAHLWCGRAHHLKSPPTPYQPCRTITNRLPSRDTSYIVF